MFPVTDARKRSRFRDRNGRMQPVLGDRRASDTTFLGKKLRRVLQAVGIPHRVTLHGLRRSFAILLQEAGASDAIIRQALGHGARGVTETHYLPRRDAAVRRWVDAIKVSIPALAGPAHRGLVSPMVSSPTENKPRIGRSGGNHCPNTAHSSVADTPSGLHFA